MSSALLENMTADIDRRIEELRPAVQEYAELAEVKSRLTGKDVSVSLSRRGRPRGSGAGRKGNRKGEIVAYLREHPNSLVKEIMEGTGISQNYTYMMVRELLAENVATRDGDRRISLVDPNYGLTEGSESDGPENTASPAAESEPEQASRPKASGRRAARK